MLKGARTVVATPDGQTAVAPFANPALSTAGSGDVLAGTIGSLLAQGLAPFDAARLGVWLHGRAAARIGERLGDSGLLASDLPYEIAVARRELAAAAGVTQGSIDERLAAAGLPPLPRRVWAEIDEDALPATCGLARARSVPHVELERRRQGRRLRPWPRARWPRLRGGRRRPTVRRGHR